MEGTDLMALPRPYRQIRVDGKVFHWKIGGKRSSSDTFPNEVTSGKLIILDPDSGQRVSLPIRLSWDEDGLSPKAVTPRHVQVAVRKALDQGKL
jgi:hypothetical protein